MKKLHNAYQNIISVENLLDAWREFVRGKKKKCDVQAFQYALTDNILALHADLKSKAYVHGGYEAFKVSDPKPRHIHKASVRDRILHHALYRVLYPYFDRAFIADSYSCRIGKGVHRSLNRFRSFGRKVSNNHTRTVWILKCDVRKCFASVDQDVLMNILKKHIADPDTLWLLERVITSFDSGTPGRGLPLGNLTSQLLINIYLNELDQFVKQQLKAKYYIRYADDFVVFSKNKDELKNILILMDVFLRLNLCFELHPDKVFIKTIASGVDFLGWVHFPDHRVLRTTTKRRMFRRLSEKNIESYLGLLSHGNGLRYEIERIALTEGVKPAILGE
ncbi:MAG: reverse transcriptase/maturase family protein [Candidatus Moraniibacteriota bacterium]